MAECSGMVKVKKKGDHVKKGEVIGNFVFGGSSYVMLLQKEIDLVFSNELYLTKDGKS